MDATDVSTALRDCDCISFHYASVHGFLLLLICIKYYGKCWCRIKASTAACSIVLALSPGWWISAEKSDFAEWGDVRVWGWCVEIAEAGDGIIYKPRTCTLQLIPIMALTMLRLAVQIPEEHLANPMHTLFIQDWRLHTSSLKDFLERTNRVKPRPTANEASTCDVSRFAWKFKPGHVENRFNGPLALLSWLAYW